MTYQRSDATPGALPSLFDGAPADTADKTISILSAATGRDGVRPAARKQNAQGRLTPFLILIAAALAGGAYWQFNQSNFERSLETSPTLAQRTPPRLAYPAKLAAINVPRAVSPPSERIDTAVVEMVKDTAVKPLPPPRAAHKKMRAEKELLVVSQPVHRPTVKPSKKSAPSLAKKSVAKKSIVAHADHPASVAFIKKELPVKPETTRQQSVVIVRSATDSDEKLLEGMLRLMKRDDPKDTPTMHTK